MSKFTQFIAFAVMAVLAVLSISGLCFAAVEAKTDSPSVNNGVDWSKLPTMSLGTPFKGKLINGVPLPHHKLWINRSKSRQQLTPEVIEGLKEAIEALQLRYPKTCRLVTGDGSKKGGGPLLPHRSHQCGRDIDIGMYAKDNRELEFFEIMTSENLDVEKTWYLIESLLKTGKIEYIFVDYSLQALLYDYAKEKRRLTDVVLGLMLQYPQGSSERRGIIRHAPGHRNHLHVRFFSAESTAAGLKYAKMDPELEEYINPEKPYHINADAVEFASSVGKGPIARALAYSAGLPNLPPPELTKIETIYTVINHNESLWSVARKYNTDVQSICEINKISQDTILMPGMQLKVAATQQSIALNTKLITFDDLVKNHKKTTTYTVREGDSIWTVAKKFNVKAADVCHWNDLTFKSRLYAGQRLRLDAAPNLLTASVALRPSNLTFIRNRPHEYSKPSVVPMFMESIWVNFKRLFKLI